MHDFEILGVENKGNLLSEYLVLKANRDIPDISFYVVTDSTYIDEEHMSNKLRHMYWFTDRSAVKKGDYIQLLTRVGIDTKFRNDGGSTTHVFYWGLKETVWNKDGDMAVVLALWGWNSAPV